MSDFTLKLGKPIPIAGGEPLKELKFREPNGEDALSIDSPFLTTYIPRAGKDKDGNDLMPEVGVKRDSALSRAWLGHLLMPPAMPDVFGSVPANQLGLVLNWLGKELNPEGETDAGQAAKN